MTAAQVKTAVRIIRHQVIEFDCEIPKLLVRDQIRPVLALVDGVLQDAVLDLPTIVATRIAQMPAGRVLAIEERTKALFIGSTDN